jgi:hypothetical protein
VTEESGGRTNQRGPGPRAVPHLREINRAPSPLSLDAPRSGETRASRAILQPSPCQGEDASAASQVRVEIVRESSSAHLILILSENHKRAYLSLWRAPYSVIPGAARCGRSRGIPDSLVRPVSSAGTPRAPDSQERAGVTESGTKSLLGDFLRHPQDRLSLRSE